jgi:succinyl-diaminopimelate desuccinylase
LDRAFEAVDGQAGRVVEILRELISVDTTVPPGRGYPEMVLSLARFFEPLGFKTEMVVEPDHFVRQTQLPLEGQRVNLVASREQGKPQLSTYAHMDTVPVDGVWSVDPVGGDVKDGMIYGRGAVDMKGSMASLILALETIAELSLETAFDLHCLFCCDEEVGIAPGVKYLAREGYIKGDLLWLEGGGQFPLTLKAMAGIALTEVTTIGKCGHSGTGMAGVNAVECMVPVLRELTELKRQEELWESVYPGLPQPGCDSDRMRPRFNLNMIQGGLKANIIPDLCRLTVDRRYLPDEDYDTVTARIRDAVEKAREESGALDIQVETHRLFQPIVLDENSPGNARARRGLARARGFHEADWVVAGICASTDMGEVREVLPDVDIVGMGAAGPATIGKAHAEDECVAVDDLLGLAKQLVYYLCAG